MSVSLHVERKKNNQSESWEVMADPRRQPPGLVTNIDECATHVYRTFMGPKPGLAKASLGLLSMAGTIGCLMSSFSYKPPTNPSVHPSIRW